jgi:hypothetical protein
MKCRKHNWQKFPIVPQLEIKLEPGSINYLPPRPFRIEICMNCLRVRNIKIKENSKCLN